MKLFFQKFGEGKPLLILHGLLGSSDNWVSAGKKLSEQFSVYLVDLRNHGRSPHSNVFDYSSMSGDIREFINDHNIDNPIIMGHSLGGKIAMQYAIDQENKIEKLIVVDISHKKYLTSHAVILDAMLGLDLALIKTRKEAEELVVKEIPDFSTRQLILKNLYWKESNRLAWRMNVKVIKQNIKEIEKSIRSDKPLINLSALFIRGEHSEYIPDEDIPEIKKLFPLARFSTVANAGHWVHADNQVGFLNTVMGFIKQN